MINSEVRLLAPCEPSKIVAVGLNYRDHAEELNMKLPEEPLLFLKPSSSVIGPGDAIIMPRQSVRVDYEAELAIVIGIRSVGVVLMAGFALLAMASFLFLPEIQEWITPAPTGPVLIYEVDQDKMPDGACVDMKKLAAGIRSSRPPATCATSRPTIPGSGIRPAASPTAMAILTGPTANCSKPCARCPTTPTRSSISPAPVTR